VEIWNLVFMQFNRNVEGELIPLPKPSVDTGMGLERLATVLQGVHSNYDTDLFQRLIAAAATELSMPGKTNQSLQVIADHIRSTSFLIADGVMPSNEGRGYVLRRIIRRAIRHGYGLGATRPFFHRLVAPLVEEMGDACPELRDARQAVERTLKMEGEKFAETLEVGITLLDREIAQLSGTQIPGDVVFKLYDTYGFPVDLTADVARERNLSIDLEGFEQAMQQQRTRARAASQFAATEKTRIEINGTTEFTGYSGTQDAAKIVALHKDAGLVDAAGTGEQVVIVLNTTPFYPQGGGQVGDRGRIVGPHGEFEVTDTQRFGDNVIGHIGAVRAGRISVTETVNAEVDADARVTTAINHSATHLVHAALKTVLGAHVEQKGSLVAPDRLRFDFSHHAPVDREQLLAVESLVNTQIRTNHAVQTTIMEIEAAKAAGAEALFGEKYDSEVRVVRMGDYSLELCGGTHVARTGDIGLFRITSETGIAAGVRRIEALTGAAALQSVAAQSDLLDQLGGLLKAGRDELLVKARQIVDRNRALEKELQAAQIELASGGAQNLNDQVRSIDDVKVLVSRHDGVETKSLRAMLDRMRQQLGSGVVVVGSARDGKVSIIAGVSADLTDRLHAGRLVQTLAAQVGGKGGGKAEMAQGGGADSEALGGALDDVYAHVATQLSGD
ncbi:MAG: alanine--tRNA ligase, partial [Gammaproteobacteria bacterium]|nr:alanine--tRNA ligase [Gammaproteobacteria bacterium]